MPSPQERRRCPRYRVDQPIKLRLADTGRYIAGRSVDRSDGGLLVRFPGPAMMPADQRVALVLADDAQPIVEAAGLQDARVVRCEPTDDGCRVAFEYEQTAHSAAAA